MRQLVTIRTVQKLESIEGADRIELAHIDGWQCVVKKGQFQAGQVGVFFEIDSVLPKHDERFSFMEKNKFRVKTMKLRGALSQGLLLPATSLTEEEFKAALDENQDLASVLGVTKYEPPMPTGGQQKGNFPTHLVPKTDQERVQNMSRIFDGEFAEKEWEITEKLDGTSCTMFSYFVSKDPMGLRLGVCSRNWEMDIQDNNVYAKMFLNHDMPSKLSKLGRGIAIQGEIIGQGIQGNHYQLDDQRFYVFDIYDIDKQEYLSSQERYRLCEQLDLEHTPVLFDSFDHRALPRVDKNGGIIYVEIDMNDILDLANGSSQLNDNVLREGLVFKSGDSSFKAISNEWLLKTGK